MLVVTMRHLLTNLWSTGRRWARDFYDFDDRLYARLQEFKRTSLFFPIVQHGIVRLICVAGCVTLSTQYPEVQRDLFILGSIVTVFVGLSFWGNVQRLRVQLIARRRRAGQCVACGYDLRDARSLSRMRRSSRSRWRTK